MSARRRRTVFTDWARSDLRDILNFTERWWGPDQRSTYRRLIRDTTSTMASSPSLGRTRDDLLPGMRSYPAGSHLLYYLDVGDELVVIRILHGRQDPAAEAWELQPLDE